MSIRSRKRRRGHKLYSTAVTVIKTATVKGVKSAKKVPAKKSK